MDKPEVDNKCLPLELTLTHTVDIGAGGRKVRAYCTKLGIRARECDEIELVTKELASNMIKFADGGSIRVSILGSTLSCDGIQIDAVDDGPGIADREKVFTDGYSSSGSLGYGLGTVNRLMDEIDIQSPTGNSGGSHIVCRKWLLKTMADGHDCLFSYGAASRPMPGMTINGDSYFVKRWNDKLLLAVIDGLGHGRHACRASLRARGYLERFYHQSLPDLFRGVGRNCYGTRGVVMALALLDCSSQILQFASIGNVQVRVTGPPTPPKFVLRRGIVGMNAPNPVVTENPWKPDYTLVLYSDGVSSRWNWSDFNGIEDLSAEMVARQLLLHQARQTDDATVVVLKRKIDDKKGT